MGIAYRIDRARGLTVFVWHGTVTERDTIDHLLQLAADTEWPNGRLSLTDLTTVGDVVLPDADLLDELVAGTDLREKLEKVVVVRPELLRGSSIKEAAASVGMDPKPFGDLESACAHLGVDVHVVRATIADLRESLWRDEIVIES
jgi:hypothetical protein